MENSIIFLTIETEKGSLKNVKTKLALAQAYISLDVSFLCSLNVLNANVKKQTKRQAPIYPKLHISDIYTFNAPCGLKISYPISGKSNIRFPLPGKIADGIKFIKEDNKGMGVSNKGMEYFFKKYTSEKDVKTLSNDINCNPFIIEKSIPIRHKPITPTTTNPVIRRRTALARRIGL